MSWPYRGRARFDSGQIALNGFFDTRLSGDITVRINDTFTQVQVTLDFDSSAHIANGSGGGGGFCNVVAIGWVNDNQIYRSIFDETGYDTGYLTPESDNSTALEDMDDFLDENIGGNFASNIIAEAWGFDQTGGTFGFHRGHNVGGYSYSKTFNTTPGDLVNEDGTFADLFPVYVAVRWYYCPDDDPSFSTWQAFCSFHPVSGFTYQIQPPVAWEDYFPWAVKSGNTWLSCNRSGMRYQVKRTSAAWGDNAHDAKNNTSKALAQHGFIKISNDWVRQLITGEES